ncbi:site-specific integrase [Flavobacteriaceae bacterium]|nr:site-specific integrase [Flavobacteriaceae bacterium]
MNIRWVKSRSTKKNKKNTTQAYLRWYENRKAITKKLEGLVKFTGRLTPQQSKWNKKVDLDVADILNTNKKELATGLFDIEKWDKTGRSFVDYGNEYINNMRSKMGTPASENTKASYKQALKLFENFFGKRKQFHNISKEDVLNFKADLYKNGVSRYGKVYEENTINTYNNRLKLIYEGAIANQDIVTRTNWFKTEGYIKVNKDSLIKEYINTKEFAKLDPTLCQCPKIAKAFMFSLLTGLRKGDLENKIKCGDLKKDEKGWHIYIAMTKGGKKIRIAITPLAMSLLGERKPDNVLLLDFYTSVSKIGYLNVWLAQTFPNKSIGQQSGRSGIVGLTFHSARASFITNMLISGISPVRVQTYVGHKDLKTTLSYYRGSTEMQEEDMLKMDDIYKAEMVGLKAKSILA